MRSNIKWMAAGLAALTGLASSGGASANPANVPFFGEMGGVLCALAPALPGRIDTDGSDNTALSSQLGSGSAGSIVITSAGSPTNLKVEAPTAWTSDPSTFGGSAPAATNFTTDYVFSGATTATGQDTNASNAPSTALGTGITTLTVNLLAETGDDSNFPNGIYRADVVVTCES